MIQGFMGEDVVLTELEGLCVTESPGSGAADVVPLLRMQASLFSRLEGFARRQRVLVLQEDTRPLLALLAERQRLSLELAQVSQRLAPVRKHWDSFRELLTVAEREEASALLEETRGSLSRVIESDEQDSRCLGVRKQMAKENLQTSQRKSTAVGAYRAPAMSSGRRLDEEQ